MANLTGIRGLCEALQNLDDCQMIVDVCSCSLFVIAQRAMVILQFIPGAGKACFQSSDCGPWHMQSAFSALRTYVLSRSKPLGIVVAALSLALVGANLVSRLMFLDSYGLPQKIDGTWCRLIMAISTLERTSRHLDVLGQKTQLLHFNLGLAHSVSSHPLVLTLYKA